MQSDGNGNLSLQYVNTIYANIYNAETSSLSIGTPLYVSGSRGGQARVFIARANNPNRRPATMIAGDNTLAPGGSGKGIISGQIIGPNTNSFPAGTEVYLGPDGGWTAIRPIGENIVQPLGIVTRQATNGRGIVLNQLESSLPNINSGSVWVGNSDGVPTAVATSSLSVANAVSASYAVTASYATNAANVFPYEGDAEITGSLGVTGSLSVTGDLIINGTSYSAAKTRRY